MHRQHEDKIDQYYAKSRTSPDFFHTSPYIIRDACSVPNVWNPEGITF